MTHEPVESLVPVAAPQRRGAWAHLVCGWAMAVLAALAVPALAAAPAKDGAAPANPRLASLRIDIWPEFDRPAALVILQGDLTPDTPLPAAVTLRIPAAAGRPSAVAYGTPNETRLLNLPHEVAASGDYGVVRFNAPEFVFHVEYYVPIATASPARRTIHAWPGDFAVGQLTASVQEPAAAKDISVAPDLGPGVTGPHGLVYRTADLGALEAGKPLRIEVGYTKPDARTSTQILGLKAPAAEAAAPAGKSAAPAASTEFQPVWVVAGAAGASLVVALAILWWSRRRRDDAPRPAPGRFCPKCGAGTHPGDQYCAACGATLKGK